MIIITQANKSLTISIAVNAKTQSTGDKNEGALQSSFPSITLYLHDTSPTEEFCVVYASDSRVKTQQEQKKTILRSDFRRNY